jgi:hypothetical protein
MAITSQEGSYQDYAYNGKVQQLTIPRTGLYRLECWGACGGYFTDWYQPTQIPYGGYSSGYKYFKKGTVIYIVCGGFPGTLKHSENVGGYSAVPAAVHGGYNGGGGGDGGYMGEGNWGGYYATGGGGATHIATANGVLSSLSNNRGAVLIVAGGGGGMTHQAANNGDPNADIRKGARGGGNSGEAGTRYIGSGTCPPGTQTSGWAFGQGRSLAINTGQSGFIGRYTNAGGGGGGWYGGSSIEEESTFSNGAGGSGYIDGVPQITFKNVTYRPTNTMGGHTSAAHGKARVTFVKRGDILRFWDRKTMSAAVEVDTLYFKSSPSATPVEITDLYYNGTKVY